MITLPRSTVPVSGSHDQEVVLRPLPTVVHAVEAVTDWTSRTVLGLLPLVEACPVLTTTILRAANLPLYGLKSKISTLSHAMAMLGVPALHKLLAGAVMGERDKRMGEGASEAWRQAVVTASLARAFGTVRAYDLPEEAYVGGLLRAMSPELLDSWHLPSFLVHGVTLATSGKTDGMDAGDPKTHELAELLVLARTTANRTDARLPAFPRRELDLATLASDLSIDTKDLETVLLRAREGLAAILEGLGITIGPESDLVPELLKAANPPQSSAPVASKEDRAPARNPLLIVRSALTELRQSPTTERILDRVAEVAHHDFRFERVLYFRLDDGGELVGSKILDESRRSVDPSDVRIPKVDVEKALAACFEERRAVVLDLTPTSTTLLRTFGTEQLGVVPVIEEDRVRGLVFVDNFYTRRPVCEELLTSLEILCSEAALLLENFRLSSESRALKKFAEKDELTGLNNRRYCIELCRKEVERARRYDTSLTLVMIDVDRFKEINDSLGHQVGDRVLREVSRLVERNSRRSDIIGRYGGDEFIVLLPEIPSEQAIVYAERMRNRVEQLRNDIREEVPGIDFAISVGVASLSEGDQDFDDLVARVDKALYAAKNRGRNRVCLG
jgi:diguanylate cyclase (GGDEF)-like protein